MHHRSRIVWRSVTVLVLVAMLAALLPLSVGAEGIEEISAATEARRAAGRPGLELVPAEVLEAFEGGISAAEFVSMTGHVPYALEGLIDEPVLVIIQMEGEPAAAVRAAQGGGPGLSAALSDHIQALETAQASLQGQVEALGAQVISNYTVVYNGLQARVPASQLAAIRALPGVVAVHPAPIHVPALGASVPLIGAQQVVEELGLDGEGIVIAIIDSGIDYTHAALGGSGEPLAYTLIDPDDPHIVDKGLFPTDKVVGGYDFAGTLYDASCTAAQEAEGICTPIPQPDPNPLDENGHGTGVASIAAGLAAGDVMTGTAPMANLMALKVFGRSGSTALTVDALEYATLHYLQKGWPQVINMSLGTPFGTGDVMTEVDMYATNLAASLGIVVVASAGNSGSEHYVTGSPATADRAISVAATTTGFVTGPTLSVEGSLLVTQTNIVYVESSFDDDTGRFADEVSAPLAYVGNLAGAADDLLCSVTGIAPDALAGQVALIQRGICFFADKVNNAAALGAVAAIVFNNEPGVFGMAGDPVLIPAGAVLMQDGEHLVPADGETVIISAEEDRMTLPDPYTPADEIATFSSRGPRGYDSALKPDLAAPGQAVFSAMWATGSGGLSGSGTSAAAPHVAGVAALLKQAHPDWTTEQVKAALMNTVQEVSLEGASAPIPLRGAGRVDAVRAITTEALAIGDEGQVSLNWGVVRSNQATETLEGTVTVHNTITETLEYGVQAALQPGSRTDGVVSVSVTPTTVVIPAGGSAAVTVTITLDLTEIGVGYGTLAEYHGALVVGPSASGPLSLDASEWDFVLVPFYFVVQPYASLEIEASGVITHPREDLAMMLISHTGPITSDLYIYPALVANEAANPDQVGAGDVRLFGMDYGWFQPGIGDILAVAISTWDWWHVPQPRFAAFDLYLDLNQDGVDDYVLFNFNLGWWQAFFPTNEWILVQVDLRTGMLHLGSPFLIFSDYNNAHMEWFVPTNMKWYETDPPVVDDLGPGAFDYQLVSFDQHGVPGVHPRGSFDHGKPPFMWGILSDPGPADPLTLALVAADSLAGYHLAAPVGVMLVDLVGDPRSQDGAQAYLVPIEIVLKHDTYQPLILRNHDGSAMIDR